MQIKVADAPVLEVYHHIVSLVTPRPIAWVSSVSAEGKLNLAPFSFYNAFGANPPVVVFSPTLRRSGVKKDTLLNVEATGEFVINGAVASLAEKVNLTAKELPADQSEFVLAGLHATPSVLVAPPRVREAPFALECKVLNILPIGNGPISANLVIGEVLMIHVDDAVLGENNQPDPVKVQTVARLGGNFWCRTSDLFEMPRP